MKFIYSYKTSANEPREGEMEARSRDAVYAKLKQDGIRPFNVRLAPGMWNKLQSFGWPAFAVPVLAAIAIAALFAYLNAKPEEPVVENSVFLSTTRRQIVGDTAVIEAGILSGWSDVFPDEGERFLASFAIPGVPAGVRATNVAELEKSLSRRIAIAPDDSMEVKQIKSMVEGMKDELRDYIGQGGTVLKYRERLFERQKQEQAYYRLFKEEINAAAKAGKPEDEILRIWKSRNAELRSMGIKLVPLPDFAAK